MKVDDSVHTDVGMYCHLAADVQWVRLLQQPGDGASVGLWSIWCVGKWRQGSCVRWQSDMYDDASIVFLIYKSATFFFFFLVSFLFSLQQDVSTDDVAVSCKICRNYIIHHHHHHHHLWLAPLWVRSATGHKQPPEWLVLGQVDCFGPWQPVGVEVVLHRLHPGILRSSWWSLPILRRQGSRDLLSDYIVVHSGNGRYARIGLDAVPWIISVSIGWLVWRRTSSLEMKWYHLMLRSIRRHHWQRALILRASSLVIAYQYDPFRKIGNIQVL